MSRKNPGPQRTHWIERIGHHVNHFGWFWFVFSVGLFLRIWSVWQTVIINPDGALYIYQAKSIVSGNLDQLNSCGLSFISIYPFLIIGAHAVMGNWIAASQTISMIFSTAALVPIFLICRCMVNTRTAALATLIASMSPVMCSRSGDVVRDPIYWFFLALGIYYVVRHWDVRSRNYYLSFSAIAFILAAWARIEAVLLIGVTAAFIFFMGKNGLMKRMVAFALPLLVLGSGVLGCMIILDLPMDRFLRLDQVVKETTAFIDSYHHVGAGLENIMAQDISIVMRLFLPEAENHIWLIAIGTMINRTLEAFFYPFVPFFLIGLWRFSGHARHDSRWWYFLMAFVSGYLLLYFHLLALWIMEYRFLMLVFIPGIPLAAAGLAWVVERLEWRWRWGEKRIFFALALLLLAAGLPKNLQPRDPDKIVFVEVAKRISEKQGNEKPALISSSVPTHRWISLYANINHPNPPCPLADNTGLWARFANDTEKLATKLRKRGVDFFLYEERYWPIKNFDPDVFSQNERFQLIGQWYHPDTGQMRLYQLK